MNVNIKQGRPKAPHISLVKVHGQYVYVCANCGEAVIMNLEMGVEEQCNKILKDEFRTELPHKPSPFVIMCPFCKDLKMQHTGATHYFEEAKYINGNQECYFAYGKDRCSTTHTEALKRKGR